MPQKRGDDDKKQQEQEQKPAKKRKTPYQKKRTRALNAARLGDGVYLAPSGAKPGVNTGDVVCLPVR
jgi:hypothetical protein